MPLTRPRSRAWPLLDVNTNVPDVYFFAVYSANFQVSAGSAIDRVRPFLPNTVIWSASSGAQRCRRRSPQASETGSPAGMQQLEQDLIADVHSIDLGCRR